MPTQTRKGRELLEGRVTCAHRRSRAETGTVSPHGGEETAPGLTFYSGSREWAARPLLLEIAMSRAAEARNQGTVGWLGISVTAMWRLLPVELAVDAVNHHELSSQTWGFTMHLMLGGILGGMR